MLLIFHFQSVLTKHCCSFGPTKQKTPGSLLISWVHGNSPVLTLNRGWDGMWCPHSLIPHQPRNSKHTVLEGFGMCSHRSLAVTECIQPSNYTWSRSPGPHQVCHPLPVLQIHKSLVKLWQFSSQAQTVPLKIICLMLTLPQAYANLLWQCIYKPLHTEPPTHVWSCSATIHVLKNKNEIISMQ